MKNTRYHIIGTIPNSYIKIVKEEKSTPLTHKYMTSDP